MSSNSSSSVPLQITTLLESYVKEKETELLVIKAERDEEREKNKQLALDVKALQKKRDDLVQEYNLAMATVEGHLEKVSKENEKMLTEKEEMQGEMRGLEGKVKQLEAELKKEKRMMKQVIDEYVETHGGRNSVVMQLIREKVYQEIKTVGGHGPGREMGRRVEVIELEDEDD